MSLCLCVCVYIHGGQKLLLGVFFSHSLPYTFEMSSLTNPEARQFNYLDWLGSPREFPVSIARSCAWGSDSDPHVNGAST